MQRYADWCLEYYERHPYARQPNDYQVVSDDPRGRGRGIMSTEPELGRVLIKATRP